jgi:riboflavin-specific deaminase-like protein
MMDRPADAVINPADDLARPEDLAPVSADDAWPLLLALRRLTDAGEQVREPWGFCQVGQQWVQAPSRLAQLWIDRQTGHIRHARRPVTTAAKLLLDLHGRHAACARPRGHVIALLGQSLDGFIATCSGQSRYINGQESLIHLHRVRALSDAVLIGVGTALADGPRLTTRNVAGPHAVRVVLDPRGRLPASSGLLCDGAAATLVVRAADHPGPAFERAISDQATAIHLHGEDGRIAPRTVLEALAGRGLRRILVEGGGVTVGRFLEAGLVDRLQLAVAPLILGAGRPALPVPPADRLDQALRPSCSRHLMGEDVLFDLDFGRAGDPG